MTRTLYATAAAAGTLSAIHAAPNTSWDFTPRRVGHLIPADAPLGL